MFDISKKAERIVYGKNQNGKSFKRKPWMLWVEIDSKTEYEDHMRLLGEIRE